MSIYFEVTMDSLGSVYEALGTTADYSRNVLKNAINATARETMNLLVKTAMDKYAIKVKSAVKETMTFRPAKLSDLEATIRSKGEVNELLDFTVSPRTYVRGGGVKSGYKGKTIKDNALKQLRYNPEASRDKHKAFIVKFTNVSKTGDLSYHFSVGQRVPGKHMKSNPKKQAVKKLLSPSIPKMLENVGIVGEEGVYNAFSPQIYDMLQSNITKQTAMQFKRLGKEKS